MKVSVRLLLVAAAIACAASGPTDAATLVYWRFEEGSGSVAQGDDTVLDQSGNGNHLRTFSVETAPMYTTEVPEAVIAQTGDPNALALDFNPNQDLYSLEKPINSFGGSAFTIEASFNADDISRYHGIVGKDGRPTASPLAPVQLKLRDDNDNFQFEIVDVNGVGQQVQSLSTAIPGVWYHLAAVYDGTTPFHTLSLYMKQPGDTDYILQGTTSFPSDIAYGDALPWTVGRGFFNGNITDWADGRIDEVRISDVALSPEQFLHSVPEPATTMLVALGFAGLAATRHHRAVRA